ncbi:MAG: DNA topoisomerase I [Omnitrophica WOR_2 bacterium RIFCSPHIGHO2_01_FULL_48_9]|nr:MAG: DNA topoisomerase I [Omnitrophica WOR_2 bacterium RIFCSPHIGHO2_02_FULL_48_11]OGX33492.1 MAG: DNA topoisomerase I [Omnitrophica WOR_2 bacterium RIFCSPHIGHO2_01_FULL_48_9]
MVKPLVIVESPTKVKTIDKILGGKYKVMSSMGHLIDLPKSTLGVDLENEFGPKFVVVRAKQKILTQLKKEAKNKKEIYIATDPDREGEAIGWNLANHLGEDKKYYRVTFQEITKEAVLKAFSQPREFDALKVNAQVARRVLDRVVGYQISPILWKKVGSRLSAGRVQSVALRLIVERERAIQNFIPQEYWQIVADLQKTGYTDLLTANLEKIKGEKFELKSKDETDQVVGQINKEKFVVSDVTQKEVKRNPLPPFITSTLQQESFNKLGFNANRTMMLAQQLYEGIDMGDGETTGLITYMRTDSVNISEEALAKVRQFIQKNYGKDYLPEKPNKYKSKKSAQEAHEAIRPSDVLLQPKDIAKYLDPDQAKLYELIWNRFVACQMVPAAYQQRKIEITAGIFQLGASGSHLLFDGYLKLYRDGEEEETKQDLSHYTKDDALNLLEVKPTQHFTKPPARYSDATLVKALEEDGIGRPSTYAAIIYTLVYRNYAVRERGYFTATELGLKVCDLLVEYFPKIMDVGFTAKMEENLDLIEEGNLEYAQLLKDFYVPFKEELDYAMQNMEKTQNFIDKHCPECGRQMVIKWGRRGKFLSCSGFPECKFAQPFLSGVKCPQPGCEGELVQRRSPRGAFYGCSKFPECRYITQKLPE